MTQRQKNTASRKAGPSRILQRHVTVNANGRFSFSEKHGACFSVNRVYRYLLWRIWDKRRRPALFIGLNPSTADETTNDPTIRRCINFATSWNCGGILVANLFAFCATNPADLKQEKHPVGPFTDRVLMDAARMSSFRIACWGIHGTLRARDAHVRNLLGNCDCFGTTKNGQPRHPLYLPASARLERLSDQKEKRDA